MRALILSCHSSQNAPLARLTAQNKWDYSERNGYDLLTLRIPWEDWKGGAPKKILEQLAFYDVVLSIGSDVLFMNPHIRIEQRITPQDNIVLAREALGDPNEHWSLINNDVVLWHRTTKTIAVLEKIIAATPEWEIKGQLWQRWLQEKIYGEAQDAEIVAAIRITPPRMMNASNHEGPEKIANWYMGDWIFHAVCSSNEDKFNRCKHYLTMSGV